MQKELPWPDTTIAHEWIKYFICAINIFYPSQFDKHPPGYLAIIHSQINDNTSNIYKLMNILKNKYGNSWNYTEEFYDNTKEQNSNKSLNVYPYIELKSSLFCGLNNVETIGTRKI